MLDLEYDLGLNVLQRMLSKGFDKYSCNELECMAYNINLDFVLRLFEKYSNLEKVSIWSNSERITFSSKNRAKILELTESERIKFFHLSENVNAIHAKLYRFKENDSVRFLAVGSPNFSEHSNQNFESLVYIYDMAACDEIWNKIPKLYSELSFFPEETVPTQLYRTEALEKKMDQKFLEGLWKHQIEILSWLANKQFSIVNTPPGTGKTEIVLRYLQYLFEADKNLTAIVLVPTILLIDQWRNRLSKVGISNLEWGTDLSNLGGYFADLGHKALVTLYSRFFDQYREYQKRAKILKPNLVLVLDECQHSYGHIEELSEFRAIIESFGGKMYSTGLSATLDSFKFWQVNNFINLMGGNENRFEISLQSFYSHWNNLNPSPVLKPIKYTPIKYCLSNYEMEQLKKYSRKIAIQMGKDTLDSQNTYTAAIQRAMWLRGLQGGVDSLRQFIVTHLDSLTKKSTIIFVQTNEIAENLQRFITQRPGWNPEASIYIYDSYRNDEYRSYALAQFKKHMGFCLISERMLSEGFDLPKVDMVILHGSHKSQRDWIQKIGRAIRFDPEDPDSIAEIFDVVFCETNGEPLSLEKERYECLTAIRQ